MGADAAEQGQVCAESDDRAEHGQVQQGTEIARRPVEGEFVALRHGDRGGNQRAVEHAPRIRLYYRESGALRPL